MEDQEFQNDFYDESSEKIIGPKKKTKKAILISIILASIIILLIILLLIILLSSSNSSSEENYIKNKKGEIKCIYDIPSNSRKIQILGQNYEKTSEFDIYIDNALINYLKEYQFSTAGKHNITFIIYEENFSLEKMFQGVDALISIELVSDMKNIYITSINKAFDSCSNLESFNINGFKTNKIKSYHKLFHNTKINYINISQFETNEAQDMSYMFSNSLLQDIELKDLKTEKLTNISHMFEGCTSLNGIIFENFDTSNVIDMSHLFEFCISLKSLNLHTFKVYHIYIKL